MTTLVQWRWGWGVCCGRLLCTEARAHISPSAVGASESNECIHRQRLRTVMLQKARGATAVLVPSITCLRGTVRFAPSQSSLWGTTDYLLYFNGLAHNHEFSLWRSSKPSLVGYKLDTTARRAFMYRTFRSSEFSAPKHACSETLLLADKRTRPV